jgi:hypothetical protein
MNHQTLIFELSARHHHGIIEIILTAIIAVFYDSP